MKWLRQHQRDLYLRVKDYFGGGYFAEYGPDDFDEIDADEIDADEYVELFQELSPEDKEQSWFDDDEPLPF